MVIRKTLQWIATLLVLTGLGGSGYAYWFYVHSDDVLKAMVREALDKKFPNGEFQIARARLDYWTRKIHLFSVIVNAKGDTTPLARCVEVIITIDGQELSQEQKIDVRSIRFVRPDIRLTREPQGAWNWHRILPIREVEETTPEFAFEDAQVVVAPNGSSTAPSYHLRNIEGRLVPSARRQFKIDASGQVAGLASVHVTGDCDIEKCTWSLDGATVEAANVPDLVQTLTQAFPAAGSRLTLLKTVELPHGATDQLS